MDLNNDKEIFLMGNVKLIYITQQSPWQFYVYIISIQYAVLIERGRDFNNLSAYIYAISSYFVTI